MLVQVQVLSPALTLKGTILKLTNMADLELTFRDTGRGHPAVRGHRTCGMV